MTPETQRGIAQAIVAFGALVFGAGSFFARREGDGFFQWPLPWEGLVSLYLASVAVVIVMTAAYWLDVLPLDLDHIVMTVAWWIAALMTVWTLQRWVRKPRQDRTVME